MDNPFKYSNTNLRYYSFSYYTKERFKSKVSKISLDAGLNCPNRDGSVAHGGCTFCSEFGSGDFIGARSEDLLTQYKVNREMMMRKWPNSKTIAYFQAYTNTYTSVDNLQRMIELFINNDEVVAIDIATRPDCLPDEMIELLVKLNEIKPIWIELGLQSMHNDTGKDFNRAYDTDVFVDTMKRLKKTKLKVCVHLINGLSNESKEMMIETAKFVSDQNVDAIKFHMLHVTKNSRMGYAYLNKPFPLLTQEQYVDIVASQLEVIRPDIIIERLTGDADPQQLIAPMWTIRKIAVINDIQKELVRRDSYQGKLYNK